MGQIVQLDALKKYLALTVTTDDDMLEDMILRAEDAARQYVNRNLSFSQFTEKRNGNGAAVLQTREFPIASIVSLSVGGVAISASATTTSVGYQFDDEAIYLTGYKFTKGVRNVAITYTAGYKSDVMPFDIRQAVIEMAGLVYRRRDHLDVSSKSLAGETISYITQSMTPAAKELLQAHMRVVPI